MNIKIIGIGGAGLNMINAVIDSGFEPENAIYIDTSRNGVWAAKTDNFLEIGVNMFKGCGSGKNQSRVRAAAELAEREILEAMKGADTVILLAGLAGGTGGGAIPFIASLALDYIGAKTIAVVTAPANIITPIGAVEGKKAKSVLKKLLQTSEECSMKKAFTSYQPPTETSQQCIITRTSWLQKR